MFKYNMKYINLLTIHSNIHGELIERVVGGKILQTGERHRWKDKNHNECLPFFRDFDEKGPNVHFRPTKNEYPHDYRWSVE